MEQQHRDRIRSNYSKLCHQFSDAIDEVCNYLFEKKIITKPMRQKILSEMAPLRQASTLLDLIVNRGPWAFGALYESCKQNGLLEVADILRPDKVPHRKSSLDGANIILAEDEQPLPGSWPTEKHHQRVKTGMLNVRKVTKDSSPQMLDKFLMQTNYVDRIYPMVHKCRGNAVIIVNKEFPSCPRLKQRSGTEFDELGLQQLFEGLGFDVYTSKNEKAESIRKIMQKEAEKDHSNHDCFVFFILSHGKKGGEVYGTNGETVKIQEMVDTFKNVEDLKGKPKLLFFQACYGDKDDTGHSVSTNDSQYTQSPVSLEDVEIHSSPGTQNSTDDDDDDDVDAECEAPANFNDKDVFEFKSAPDGLRAYRHSDWGSWFAQAVIYVFSEYAYKCDFLELTQKVKLLLSKAETRDEKKLKNIAVLKHTPGKTLYFFPGQYSY